MDWEKPDLTPARMPEARFSAPTNETPTYWTKLSQVVIAIIRPDCRLD